MRDHLESEDFDWVKTRNECTAKNAFKALKAAAIADMATRIGQDSTLKRVLSFNEENDDIFSIRKANSYEVVFEMEGETIIASRVHMSGATKSLATVTVGMNNDGECTLTQGNKELLSWQFRRIALEGIFFDTPA